MRALSSQILFIARSEEGVNRLYFDSSYSLMELLTGGVRTGQGEKGGVDVASKKSFTIAPRERA